MANPRDRLRAGRRPALYGSLFVAVLFVVGVPMVPNTTVAQARLEFVISVVGTFLLITALYASGFMEPREAPRRTNPWVLGLFAVMVVVVIATECFGA